MTVYIAPEYRELLESNSLNTFDLVWAHPVTWLDEPNRERGGWSGVGRIVLESPQGEVGAYLKRQDNHGRWSWRYPIAGEPTFIREFKMLGLLNRHGIPVPKLLFFARHLANGQHRAVLMLEELADYRPLDEVVHELFSQGRPTLAEQKYLLKSVARTVRSLHRKNIEHRALYPKHIFIKVDGTDVEIALIDLEKARFNLFSLYSTYLDLASLNKHSNYWSRSRRLYFYKQYFGIRKLGFLTKWFCRLVQQRSMRGRGKPRTLPVSA
jgi:hypothetical protein